MDRAASKQWPACYAEHPVVREARDQGFAPPIPLALFSDGLAYNRQAAGRQRGNIVITLCNLVTNKRQYVTSIPQHEMRTCGLYVSWIITALAKGMRTTRRYTGTIFGSSHVMHKCMKKFGSSLGFRGALIYMKSDLLASSKTHGLQSTGSFNDPCTFCWQRQANFNHGLDACNIKDLVWDLRRPHEYFIYCEQHGHNVIVGSEQDRSDIMYRLHYESKPGA